MKKWTYKKFISVMLIGMMIVVGITGYLMYTLELLILVGADIAIIVILGIFLYSVRREL